MAIDQNALITIVPDRVRLWSGGSFWIMLAYASKSGPEGKPESYRCLCVL
jgi:hypothetical protein